MPDCCGDVTVWIGERGGRGGGGRFVRGGAASGSNAAGRSIRPGVTAGMGINTGAVACTGFGDGDGAIVGAAGVGSLPLRAIVSASVGRRNAVVPGTTGLPLFGVLAEFGSPKADFGGLRATPPVLNGEGWRLVSLSGGGGGRLLSLDELEVVVEAEFGTVGDCVAAVLPLLVFNLRFGGRPVRDMERDIFDAGVSGVIGVCGVRGVRGVCGVFGDLTGVPVREGALFLGDMILSTHVDVSITERKKTDDIILGI